MIGKIDFVFSDSDVDLKLNEYFGSLLGIPLPVENKKLNINNLNRIYIQLNPAFSRCLYLVSEDFTANEIGKELNKSIEKYILKLKRLFGVEKKEELKEVYLRVKSNPVTEQPSLTWGHSLVE